MGLLCSARACVHMCVCVLSVSVCLCQWMRAWALMCALEES